MQNTSDHSERSAVAPLDEVSWQMALSCWIDGETPPDGLPEVGMAVAHEDQAVWRSYCQIGESLRQTAPPLPPADPAFAAAVLSQLQDVQPPRVMAAQPQAANDEVFRWKMLAGVASVAAAASLAWPLLRSSGDPVLAERAPSTLSAPLFAVNGGEAVVVRDPQLEAFLAAHRQQGTVSALQLPAGFLRNATYEPARH